MRNLRQFVGYGLAVAAIAGVLLVAADQAGILGIDIAKGTVRFVHVDIGF